MSLVHTAYWYVRFRNKFRMPRSSFDEIVAELQKLDSFKDKSKGVGHGRGPPRHPLQIKVLACLRMLGKGIDYDTVCEGACISEPAIKKFFHKFIQWLAGDFYQKWVQVPTGQKLQDAVDVFTRLGFPGAMCSTDGVHIHNLPLPGTITYCLWFYYQKFLNFFTKY